MIARPKISQIEWETIEIRGFKKLANISPCSCPGEVLLATGRANPGAPKEKKKDDGDTILALMNSTSTSFGGAPRGSLRGFHDDDLATVHYFGCEANGRRAGQEKGDSTSLQHECS